MVVRQVFMFVGVAVFALEVFAQAGGNGPRPVECIRSKTANDGKTTTQTLVCTDFDRSYPNNFAGVCIFKSGSWQYGDLKWDPVKKKHVFVSRFSCDAGVNVSPEQSTLVVASPAVGDYFEGRKDRVDRVGSNYVSKMTVSSLGANEVPVSCYTRERNGVPVDALACESMPNDAGYCEFRDVGTIRGFRGKWFVRYAKAGRKGMAVCAGGVKASKLEAVADEYGEAPKKVVVQTLSIANFNALLPKPMIDGTNEIDVQMSTCNYTVKKPVAVVCKNQATGGFDDWVSDEKAYEASLREVISLPFAKRLGELRRLIARKLSASALAAYKAEQAAIYDQIEDAVAKGMDEADKTYMGKYPMNKTSLAIGECGIDWNPKDSKVNGPYVMVTVGSKIVKQACATIEAVQLKQLP